MINLDNAVIPVVVEELDSDGGRIFQLAWSPGGLFLAAASETGSVLLWRRERDNYYLFHAKSDLIERGKVKPWCLAWSAGGHIFSGWTDGIIREFQSDNLKIVRQAEAPFRKPVLSLAMQPGKKTLVSVSQESGEIILWNTGGKKIETYGHLPGHDKQSYSISWHAQGKILASCGSDGVVRLWHTDAKSGLLVEGSNLRSSARQAVWSPDQDLLLALIEDEGRALFWRVGKTNTIPLIHQGRVSSIAFSPDGSLCVSKSYDGKVRLWRAPTGEFLRVLEDHGPSNPLPWPPFTGEVAFRIPRQYLGWEEGEGEERRSAVSSSREAPILANLNPSGQRVRLWEIQREERTDIQREEHVKPEGPKKSDPKPRPLSPPSPVADVLREAIRRAGVQDQPTDEDRLGFDPYVKAVADFLSDPGTQPPLTLSIEGDWGSGKSSFMSQVAKRLRAWQGPHLKERMRTALKGKASGKSERSDEEKRERPGLLKRLFRALTSPRPLILSFNIWRHDKEEAVWAAFALGIMRQLRQQCGWPRRFLGWLRLSWWRLQWIHSFFILLRILGWGVIIVLVVNVASDLKSLKGKSAAQEAPGIIGASQDASDSVGVFDFLGDLDSSAPRLALLVLVVTVLLNAKQLLGNPLDLEMGKYLRSTGWEDRIAFIERFHEDFDRMVRAYAGDRRVYIFVDDLDRCDVPKAAELMQAINLLIAENPKIFFILGMDRQKVAAGLAVKYERLFPYLFEGLATLDKDSVKADGLEHGYEFIEKFVQISFQLPKPSSRDIENLLIAMGAVQSQASPPTLPQVVHEPPPASFESTKPEPALPSQPRPDSKVAKEPPNEPESTSPVITPKQLSLEIDYDSDTVIETVLMVSPVLDYNPRRVKKFVNSFRLRAFIAYQTGLLAGRESQFGRFTFFQLGKLVALNLRWPLLLADLEGHRQLLKKLEAIACGRSAEVSAQTPVEKRWAAREKLMELLRFGSPSPSYSLATLDVELILLVAPPVVQHAQSSGPLVQGRKTA